MAFSKAMIIGNLGRDPEMRYTPSGRPVTEFSVAVNQSTKNQQTGEWVEATDWFRVTVWGDRAERTAEQLRKGTRVFVEGRFRTREFEARDGQKRISLEITADNVISLDPRVRDEEGSGSFAAPSGGAAGSPGAGPGGGPGAGPAGPGGPAGPAGPGAGEGVRPTRPSAPRDDDLDDLPF